MLPNFLVVGLALVGSTMGRPSDRRKQKAGACQNLVFPVTVSANNLKLPTSINPQDPLGFLSTLDPSQVSTALVNGTYNIAARYCEPETGNNNLNTLQILGHGNTYDKNYWSGLGFPGFHGDEYSWIAYASKHGYPTLSIDQLGNGDSSHPDPVSVVQLPIQVEVLHQIISIARSGNLLSSHNRSFDKIVYAGHSYGSFIGNRLSAKYPSDVEAFILTGFTNQPLSQSLPGNVANAKYLPAALVNPARFGSLPLGYLTGSSKSGRETVFYTTPGLDFDPNLFELDWATAATATIGEAATSSVANAPNYTGAVFVLTGRNDTLFCGHGTGDGDCGQGATSIPAKTRALYPNVSEYGYYIPEDAGHDWNFHFSAMDGFKKAHEWMATLGL